jgi:hypothetical protein
MLAATYDDATGIVTTIAEGMTTVAEFNAYLPVLTGFMRMSAAARGKWLHLVDATDNHVQPKDTTAYVAKLWDERPRDDGYTAYVVSSVLAKMQIQRMRDNPNKAFFTDRASAKGWLIAHVDPAAAASAG